MPTGRNTTIEPGKPQTGHRGDVCGAPPEDERLERQGVPPVPQAGRDHPLHTAFYVKADTGMRRDELLGATSWIIGFGHARVSVTQTVTAPD